MTGSRSVSLVSFGKENTKFSIASAVAFLLIMSIRYAIMCDFWILEIEGRTIIMVGPLVPKQPHRVVNKQGTRPFRDNRPYHRLSDSIARVSSPTIRIEPVTSGLTA